MRSIVVRQFGGADVLQVEEVADPQPGAGEVVVRIEAAGVNPADTYIRTGEYAFFKPAVPYTPGFDGAGVVESVGSDVTGCAIGDRVFVATLGPTGSGTYAERVVCAEDAVHPLPDELSFAEGAAIGVPWLTAYRALFQRGGLQAGEVVLVHGASGGVGLPAVQMARRAGAVVIGTAGTEAGQDLVRSVGAQHVLGHGALDDIASLTDGQGVDLVVEMRAELNLEADTGVLAPRGRIVVVGSRGSLPFTPRALMFHEADVRGTALWNMSPGERTDGWSAIQRFLADGHLTAPIGAVFPLEDARLAHEHVLNHPATGKCILDCR
ncbi:NADPH:quinone reductase [Kribbella sp. NPDC026611]|uniref:NADPH:quinone reductase n=1 Tax=Kribbella sp. NPDC026611 TaxID=3154911 RepID=UPI0033D67BA0